MNKSQTIIFCAQQRSGTTVLQRAFEETGVFKNYREIFHHLSYDNPNNHFAFFNFKRHLIQNDLNFSFPSEKNQKHIFDRFFDKLENQTRLPYNIVDIKYNSWHHLNPIWHSANAIPSMLRWAKMRKVPIIHIIRKNSLHQYISQKVAKSTEKWHFEKNEDNKHNKKVYINPGTCKMLMRIVKRDTKNFQDWLDRYPLKFEIFYEDLIVNNKFSQKMNNILSEITSGRVKKLGDPPLKKGITDPFSLIQNKQELVRELKNTQFSKYIED